MSPCAETSAEEHPLAGHVERLTEELQAIGDILEGIRTDLAWALQNGRVIVSLGELERLEHVADATLGSDAFDLTIRLHMALAMFGAELADAIAVPSVRAQPPSEVRTPAGEPGDSEFVSTVVLYEVGDAVEFAWEGEELFGEIVALDDARNRATIMLIPSEDELTVCQDDLTKVVPDELAYGPPPVMQSSGEFTAAFAAKVRPPLPSPRLEPHRSPDRQQNLF